MVTFRCVQGLKVFKSQGVLKVFQGVLKVFSSLKVFSRCSRRLQGLHSGALDLPKGTKMFANNGSYPYCQGIH